MAKEKFVLKFGDKLGEFFKGIRNFFKSSEQIMITKHVPAGEERTLGTLENKLATITKKTQPCNEMAHGEVLKRTSAITWDYVPVEGSPLHNMGVQNLVTRSVGNGPRRFFSAKIRDLQNPNVTRVIYSEKGMRTYLQGMKISNGSMTV